MAERWWKLCGGFMAPPQGGRLVLPILASIESALNTVNTFVEVAEDDGLVLLGQRVGGDPKNLAYPRFSARWAARRWGTV